jgi:transaldolase
MPPATLEAFADHGAVARTIDKDVPEAKSRIAAIEALGVKLDDVTEFLVQDGVKKFADSFTQLLAAVETKKKMLVGSR